MLGLGNLNTDVLSQVLSAPTHSFLFIFGLILDAGT